MKHIDGFTYAEFLHNKYLFVESEKKKMEQKRLIQNEKYRLEGAKQINPFLRFLQSKKVKYEVYLSVRNNPATIIRLRYNRDNYLEMTIDYSQEKWHYRLVNVDDFYNNSNGNKKSIIIESKDLYFFIEHFYHCLYGCFNFNKHHLINGVRHLFEADFNGKSNVISFI